MAYAHYVRAVEMTVPPAARYRPCRDNRDPLAVLEWQLANDWEGFIPTPMGEARRWLERLNPDYDCEAGRAIKTLLEYLDMEGH